MNKKDGACPWTPEEDTVLVDAYADVGNKWTSISKMLPGRTDNAVKNRHALLQRKRGVQRQGSATQIRKRSKPEPAAAPACGSYEDGLRVSPVRYNYVQPSDFYAGMASGMASAPLVTDTANLRLLSAFNMQQIHPSMHHLHPSFPPTLFQQQARDTLLQQHAHMQSTHASGLNGQYGGLANMYGYGAGNMATADNMYEVMGIFGHHASHQHQQAIALGLATGAGTAAAADSNDTPKSTHTVTGHPSIFHQSGSLPTEQQGAQDQDAPQPSSCDPTSCDPFLECSHNTADRIVQK